MNEKQKQAIEKMYKKGLVNVQEIAEPMLERYDELDIQQCRFVIEYLLADRDFTEDYINDLEKEIDRLKDLKED